MKTFTIISAVIIILLGTAIGIAPNYFSTSSGNQMLAKIINWKISGSVAFDEAEFSWTGKQVIKNLTLLDHKGNFILSVSNIETETPLLTLLTNGNFGESQIRNLNIHLIQQDDGTSNLQQAIESDIPPDLNPNKPPLVIDLQNINGMVSMGTLSIPRKIHLIGTTKQGDIEGSFNVEIDSHDNNKQMIMNTQIKQFPVAVLDQLIAYKEPKLAGIASTALGSTLDFDLNNTLKEGVNFFKLSISSADLLANLHGEFANDLLTITTPSEVSLTITPALISYFTDDKLLDHDAKAVFVLDQMNIPLKKELNELAVKFHLDQNKTDPEIIKYVDGTEISLDTKKGSKPHLILVNQDIHADLLIDVDNTKVVGSVRIMPDIDLGVVAELTSDKAVNLSVKGSHLNIDAYYQDLGNNQIRIQADRFPITKVCHQ